MYPFLFFCVVMCCEVCVVMFCPCQTVVLSFWKWCMHDCVILEGVILVCVVCESVMCAVWPWYERSLPLLSDMITGAWLWMNLNCSPFFQNIDIFITQYGFKI